MTMMVTFVSVALLLNINGCLGGSHNYWWMSDPSVFSSGKGPQQDNQVGQVNGNYGNQPQQNIDYQTQEDGDVETECPVGTKCVADDFCNEHAVMVFSRIQLTPAQKRNRGKLIPCVNGNGGFDVCCSTATSSSPSLSPQTPVSFPSQTFSGPDNQRFQSLQQPGTIPAGECPNVTNLPPVETCANKASNCWSVGQADVDCPNNALCCFDGCVNACYYGGSLTLPSTPVSFPASDLVPPEPLPPPRAIPEEIFEPSPPAPEVIYIPPPPQTFEETSFPESVPAVYEPEPNPPAFNTPAPFQDYVPQQPEPTFQPQPQPTFQPQPQPTFQPTQVQQPQSPPRKQTSYQPSKSSGSFESADTKPFVTCPSAMKCVPRENCDFNGVMTEQTLRLTPDLEMLRVPLIPCVNPMTTNIDVCCRDPNYKDPWPDMDNGNDGQNFNGGNNGQNFNGNIGQSFESVPSSSNNDNVGIVPRVETSQKPARRPSYGK